MSNLRLQIIFRPSNLLTTVGSEIYLLPRNSYLRILNSVQLVKVNSTNHQPLKIGQSFYLYFHFSEQYVLYDQLKRNLRLSKNVSERTQFKILTDHFDWNSRGNIQIGMLFKYRIILAQNSSRFLNIQNGQLVANSNQNENSLVSFQSSIYSLDSIGYPIKLRSLQQNLTICYKNSSACLQTRPSICQQMILLQKKQNSEYWAIKHVDSNSYLLKSGKQFIFLKDAPSQLKFCLRIHNYDESGRYLYLSTIDNQFLGVDVEKKKCIASSQNLQNIFVKNQCLEQSIKNILVSAWLKSEQSLSPNNSNILYMLEQCQKNFQLFSEVYDQNVVEGLITEGFFLDLQYIIKKYPWELVGSKIIMILQMILRINKSWISELFNSPRLYQKLMKQQQFRKFVQRIEIGSDQVKNPHKTLQDVQDLIFKEKQLSLASIETLEVVMPLIQRHKNQQKHKQLKQFIQFAVQKIIPQIKKQSLSSFFIVALKLVKSNTTTVFFSTQIMKNLSLSLLQNQKLSFEHKLSLVQVFNEQIPPYMYICSQQEQIRPKSHDQKNQKAIQFFINEILPKNCRFQTYQFKTISISLLKYHLKINQNLQLHDCKQFVKSILQTMSSYYYDETPVTFLKKGFESFLQLMDTIFILCCKKSQQYDSLTSDMKIRTQKCKKEIQPFVHKQIINFSLLWNQFSNVRRLTIDEKEIFILALKICQRVIYPEKYFLHLLSVIKVADTVSQNFIKIVHLFLARQHEFFPLQASERLINLLKGIQEDELTIIAHIIDENNLYEKITFKSEAFYKFINAIATIKIIQFNILNGNKILDLLKSRKGRWLHNDSEFIFLKNLINMIGGVVSNQIYDFYSGYLCHVQPNQWSLYYFRLCTNFFLMSPPGLKKRFVIKYHQQLKSANEGLKLHKLFFDKGSEFTNYYITLLLGFVGFHSSKQLIYEIIGDQTLFAIIQQFTDIQLRIKILNLMIKARKRTSQFGNIIANSENIFWLKKGTYLIRQKLGKLSVQQNQTTQKANIIEISFIKDYSLAILQFLEMRQEIISKTEMSEDDLLVFQGTNKIFAFKVAEFIGETVKNQNIQKQFFQKILWFQNKYKISIDLVQLTQISIQIKQEQKNNENFQYKYMLAITPQTSLTSDFMMTKITIQVYILTLLNISLSICFDNNPSWSNLQLTLNHLHFAVSYRSFNFTQKQLQLLFLLLRKLIKFKKLKFVAITQNIIRKAIWNQGKLQVKNQQIVQSYVIKYKNQTFDYLFQCINNYIIFSPIYESTLNYFNSNGQQSICWTVSCYVSTIRFLISLCKSLKLSFKEIFSQTHTNRKQFIGQLIEVNKKHISELFKSTSNAKLTIIAYQIELINNLLRGPSIRNIEIALKFKYQNIISLITLPDLHEDPSRISTFNIIVYLKKLVVQSILILAPFEKFNQQQTRIIEDGLAEYYQTTSNLVRDMRHIIEMYTKQNKGKIQVMNFDLALNLFLCLMKIYDRQNNQAINQLRRDFLKKKKLDKTYSKKLKIFYQIYKIIAELLSWIGRTIYKAFKRTASQIDEAMNIFQFLQRSRQQKLNKAFQFFVRNVASIQVQIDEKLETIFFLLLKQTECYNKSIRKQLHRNVGLDQREFRLKKFMIQSNHIIMRLQVEKKIKLVTEKYKPLQIIIKNRQLWKSMNFLCACILNVVFLDENNITNAQVPLYIVRCMSLVFSLFLFLIYLVQNLPLKRKLAQKMAKNQKQKFKFLKSCLIIFNDKTLWFASIYLAIICLSFYQEGFVAILMIDFFVRFKISKQVTEIITRPILQLAVVVLISLQFAYIFTCYLYSIHSNLQCPNISSCIQSTYIQYLGLSKNSLDSSDLDQLSIHDITEFFLTFLAIMINNSLIIGVLIYEKKKKDNNLKQWQKKVKQRCFICDKERSTIDRARNNNKGFYQHIEVQQNLWNYIYYLIYLKNKQLDSLNIVQNMVLSQWKQYKFDWLPKKFN